MEIKDTNPHPTGIEAKRENHVKVVLEVPEWVLDHKYASFVLTMLDDTDGLEANQKFYYYSRDLQSIETTRREAVEVKLKELRDKMSYSFYEMGEDRNTDYWIDIIDIFLQEKPQ